MKENFNLYSSCQEKELPIIAVAIAGSPITRSVEQRHLGILIGNQSAPLLLHLGWHKSFKLEMPPSGVYFWSEACIGINEALIESFADWLNDLWEVNNDEVGYSLIYDYNRDYFDENGHMLINEPGTGLTCATFVIECFKCFGMNFIDFSSWPSRPEDKLWFDSMLDIMKQTRLPSEHVEKQNYRDFGCRFRPEEVLVSAHLARPKVTVSFEMAQRASQEILELMRYAQKI